MEAASGRPEKASDFNTVVVPNPWSRAPVSREPMLLKSATLVAEAARARCPAASIARALVLAACMPVLAGCDARSDAQRDADRQAQRGRLLLARYHCGTCHTIPGVAASRGEMAVSLAAFGRRSYIAGRVANEPATLARWIADPAAIVPGTLMPDLGVAPDDARDMAVYLGRLK
jgi:cytochrome c